MCVLIPHTARSSQTFSLVLDMTPVFLLQLSSPEEKCQQVLEPPYDEMVAAHLRYADTMPSLNALEIH